MSSISILLKAYYERLYEKLQGARDILVAHVEKVLTDEIMKRGFEDFTEDKYAAYREASIAFIDERIEAYNPTGVQYTFDNANRRLARELELQLDWYDSRSEFAELLGLVREKAEPEMDEKRVRQLADQIIKEFGVFPDRSIIAAYEAKPELFKLPDYAVARAIESVVR
jgi:hypothetical protein